MIKAKLPDDRVFVRAPKDPARPAAMLGAVLAAAMAITAGSATARDAGWYISGHGGFSSVEDADTSAMGDGGGGGGACLFELPGSGCIVPDPSGGGGATTTSGEISFDDGTGYSLAIGRPLRRLPLRPELSLTLLENDLDEITFADGSSQELDGEQQALGLMANLWYDFELPFGLSPYIGAGIGARQIEFSGSEGEDDDTVFGYQAGAGIGWEVVDRLTLSLDYRYLDGNDPAFENSDGSTFESEFRAQTVTLGLRYLFLKYPPPDADGDGVPDESDACPGTRAGVDVDTRGCALDSDGDGVIDAEDDCPGTPSGVSVDTSGCPLDSDGDGVSDDNDRCPGTAPGMDVDRNGCPRDSDGDGVSDAEDDCPGTPAGTEVTANGCAVGQSLELRGVEFEFDSATLTARAESILVEQADIIKSSPGFRIEVQGHTDDVGSSSYNQRLSQRRAEAVRDFLIAEGVAAHRLEAVGYGESRPKVPNVDADAREENRRVELKILDD